MQLDRAIHVLEVAIPTPEEVSANDMIDAMQLGIEALKRLRDLRNGGYAETQVMLPGETKK